MEPEAEKNITGTAPEVRTLPFEYLPDKDYPKVVYVDGERAHRARTLVGSLDHRQGRSNYGLVFVGRWFQRCRNLEMAVQMAVKIAMWESQFAPVYESSDDGAWTE